MPFAGKENDIALLRFAEGISYCLGTVNKNLDFRFAVMHTLQNIVNYKLRVFASRIIRGYNRNICKVAYYLAHFRAFGLVSVAAAAEYGYNSAVCGFTDR